MTISPQLLDDLATQARQSPRLRVSFDLRNSPKDQSQRVLNALQPGTVVPIHRHTTSSETAAIIRGALKILIYNHDKSLKESFTVAANSPLSFYMLPPNTWHSCQVLQPDTIMFEAKDGPYSPLSPSDILE